MERYGLPAQLKEGCVLFIPGEVSGTTAFDISGNGNNGTLVNSPTPTRGGLWGYEGLKFNGTSQYVTVADANSLDFGTGDFSCSFVVNPVGGGQYDIINQYSPGMGTGWYISRNLSDTSKIEFGAYQSGSGAIVTSNSGFFDNDRSVAVTVVRRNSGTSVDFFKNGALYQTVSIAAKNVTNDATMRIATNSNNSGSFLNGKLSLLHLANYALSADEASLYAKSFFIP